MASGERTHAQFAPMASLSRVLHRVSWHDRYAMTENSTPPASNRSTRVKRAPGWIAPVIAAVLCIGLTWGIGMSLFRGSLENRGLPEEIRDSSAEQRQLWQYGSTLANLGSQAKALAAVADKKTAPALNDLSSTLSYGAQLTGQLSFDDQPEVELAQAFTPAALSELTARVTQLSTVLPTLPADQSHLGGALTELAYQSNLQARSALRTVQSQKKVNQLPTPLVVGAGDTEGEPVGCLSDLTLLPITSEITDPALTDDVLVARALDRGYALDYALQLQAARGSREQAPEIEERRTKLSAELRAVRSVLPADCADLRQPAYVLPQEGLKDLAAVAEGAEEDFAGALALASGAASERAQDTLANTTWQVLLGQRQRGLDPQLIKPGA